MWYQNPQYNFSRVLRPLNYDNNVLQLVKDANGCNLINVYAKHGLNNPEIIYEGEINHDVILMMMKFSVLMRSLLMQIMYQGIRQVLETMMKQKEMIKWKWMNNWMMTMLEVKVMF